MTEGEGQGVPQIPELAERYFLIAELGRGGTSVVYLARDQEVGRTVAIKLIRPDYAQDEEAVARLIREARTVGQLQHPNIVLLLGTQKLESGGLALILQYVPGSTLREHLQVRGALSIEECTSILRDLARALEYAHRSRIVHRDIKPENVYLDEASGLARLADFGIARAWDSDSNLTLPGSALGTPTYMSPEQVDGSKLDGRSDIYSLGLLGWEMLTGRQPWEGESLYSVILKQKKEDLPSVSEIRADAPPSLVHTIERALRKDPSERWPDATGFLGAMEDHASSRALASPGRGGPEAASVDEPSTRPPSPQVPVEQGSGGGRRRGVVAGMLLFAALLLAGLWVMEPQGEIATSARGVVPWGGWGGQAPVGASPDAIPDTPDRSGDLPSVGLPAVADREEGEPEPDGIAEEGEPRGFQLRVVLGEAQAAPPGTQLQDPLVLRLVDGEGTGVEGVPVTFQVVQGDGTAEPSQALTDPDGTVWTRWTMGPEGSGNQLLLAQVAAGAEGEEGVPSETPGPAAVVQLRASLLPAPVAVDELAGEEAQGMEELDDPVEPLIPTRPSLNLAPRAVVSAGGGFSCSLSGGGAVRCWGRNQDRELGDGGEVARRVLAGPSLTGGPFARLATGVSHACALRASGHAVCWGSNTHGQAGGSTGGTRATPADVPGDLVFEALALGLAHSCGLAPDGSLHCWGANDSGQLGDGSREARPSPARVGAGERFTAVTAGWRHTCALDGQGRAFCWGEGSSGQLGTGNQGDTTIPREVIGGHRFRSLDAGNTHTCGVRSSDGAVLCWGSNQFGQVGAEAPAQSAVPVVVEAPGSFVSVTAGGAHSCAVASDGAAYCWGRNAFGQLGNGATQDRNRPEAVSGGHEFTSIHAVGSHTCGRSRPGRVHCWGYNLEGQLGDGTRENRASPILVEGGED
jgi:alpha-tubulin suppressor-like RCC1 family protein